MNKRLMGPVVVMQILLAIWLPKAQSASGLPTVRIGIARDGPSVRFQESVGIFQAEILDLNSEEFDIRFPTDKDIHGNWTVAGVRDAVNRLLADPEVDLILAMGPNTSNEVCQRKRLTKPVIAPFIIDAQLQDLPFKDGASGVKNLNYLNSFTSFESDVKTFREIVSFRTLVVLVDSLAVDSIPELRQKVLRVGFEYSINIELIPVDTSADETLALMPPETDAVYITPLLRFSPDAFQQLVDGLIRRHLPTFSMWGRDEVEVGILAGVAPKSDFTHLARRVALNVQSILLGEDAGTLELAFLRGKQLTINMAIARAIGVYPSWSVLTEAELLNEEIVGAGKRLSLTKAVQEAIAVNLDLAVENRSVAAGEQLVNKARSVLLPRLDLDAGGVIIDDDRAEGSLGTQAERSVKGSATATQLVYSEDAWTNYRVEQHLQTSREEQLETLKLDITLDTAVAYLNVLRTKTLERIRKANLRLSRANLERARVRVSIGIASRAEVFRWEGEIANSRKDVLQAQTRRRQTETNLNRLLNRPLETRFIYEDEDLSNPLLLVSDKRFYTYVDNPRNFSLFRDFLVEEGLKTAPELRRLDAAIAARERILAAAKRAFWLPTFSLQGNVTETFDKEGAGSKPPSLPIELPQKDDTDWSVGVFATFPLVEGGGKFATIKRAREELTGLNLERESTAEKIGERVSVTLDTTGFSYPSIELSQEAARATRKNLELVTDSYERGAVSIVDLLDAQNASLVADRAAENAVYDFLIDLMRVQRAVGTFDFFLRADEREAWFKRLETFFRKAGVTPNKR